MHSTPHHSPWWSHIQRTAQPLSITTTQPKLSHTNKQSCCSAHPSLSTPSTRRTSCTWIVLLVLIGAMRFLYQQHNRCNHFLLSHCFLACQWSRSPLQPPMFFNKAASPHIVVPRKIMRNSSLLLLALPFRSYEETMGNKRATWSRWNLVHLANKIKISKHCYYCWCMFYQITKSSIVYGQGSGQPTYPEIKKRILVQ